MPTYKLVVFNEKGSIVCREEGIEELLSLLLACDRWWKIETIETLLIIPTQEINGENLLDIYGQCLIKTRCEDEWRKI